MLKTTPKFSIETYKKRFENTRKKEKKKKSNKRKLFACQFPNNRLPFGRARFDDDPQSSASSQPSDFGLPLDLAGAGSSSHPSLSFFLFCQSIEQSAKYR